MAGEATTASTRRVRAAGRPASGRSASGRSASGRSVGGYPLGGGAVVRTVTLGVVVAAGAGMVVALVGPVGYVVYCMVIMGGAVLLTKRALDRTTGPRDTPQPAEAAPWASGEVAIPVSGPGEVTRPVAGLSLERWSDEELCWAWRRSYAQLMGTTDAEVVSRLAEQRHGYLCELERRHPARFAAWLHSGARAAGDPTRFIRPHRTP